MVVTWGSLPPCEAHYPAKDCCAGLIGPVSGWAMCGARGHVCALICSPVSWHTDTLGNRQLNLPDIGLFSKGSCFWLIYPIKDICVIRNQIWAMQSKEVKAICGSLKWHYTETWYSFVNHCIWFIWEAVNWTIDQCLFSELAIRTFKVCLRMVTVILSQKGISLQNSRLSRNFKMNSEVL